MKKKEKTEAYCNYNFVNEYTYKEKEREKNKIINKKTLTIHT